MAGTDHGAGGSSYAADAFSITPARAVDGIIDLDGRRARFVRLEAGSCPQPNGSGYPHCGMGEIAFSSASICESAAAALCDDDFVGSEYLTSASGEGSSSATTAVDPITGDYRRVSLSVAPFEGSLNVQLYSAETYTPATQGPLAAVAVGYDVRRVYNSIPGATQISKGIAVEQDGIIHTFGSGVSTSTSWEYFQRADVVSCPSGRRAQPR